MILKSHQHFFEKAHFRDEKNPHTDNTFYRSERVKEALNEVNDIPRTTTISYSSTTPWNSTGFYYSPRYPQSHRGITYSAILAPKSKCYLILGTASTYYNNAYARRYYPNHFDDFNYYNPHAYKLDYFR